MITTRGRVIEINDKLEWLLFNRLTSKVHPVEFLKLTDCFTQFPNLLITISFLVLIFVPVDPWLKFTFPPLLYCLGQAMISFRFGAEIINYFKYPLWFFNSFSVLLMAGTVITGIIFMNWVGLVIVPVYFLILLISVYSFTLKESNYYKSRWNKNPGIFEINLNNAFLLVYKYYAEKYQLVRELDPTAEETRNEDWRKPYLMMRSAWYNIEKHFNEKARLYWRIYLHIS